LQQKQQNNLSYLKKALVFLQGFFFVKIKS